MKLKNPYLVPRTIRRLFALAAAALPLPAAEQQKTLYVDGSLTLPVCTTYDVAGRSCSGGSATAYRTLTAALPFATAGTAVVLRGGSYAGGLVPAFSGEEGRPVEFRSMAGETVNLTAPMAITLVGRSHIVIDGMTVADTSWLESRNSHHNVIRNCTFLNTPATGTSGNARFVQSHYNRILNNRFDRGNDNLLLIDSNFNVVEGNTIVQGRHSVLGIRCGDYNIIRGNYFANSWQKIAEVFDCGADTSAVANSFNSTRRNVFENNIFADALPYYSTSGGNGIQYAGQNGIIRRNIFYHCNVGLGMQVYADEALYNRNNNIYHNVFADNFGVGIETGSGTSGNVYKNNILYANRGILPDAFADSPGQLAYRQSLGSPAYFERNDLFYQVPGQAVVEEDFNVGRTVSQAEALFGGQLVDTLEVDPRFVDAAGLDFRLRSDSTLRDVAAWLTKTTAAGSGSTLPVGDAGVFHDGFGIPGEPGDLIQLEGRGETARILRIDHGANTLTVDRELTWTAGQGVSLPYAGPRPDLGAFETAATPDGIGEWRQRHFGTGAADPALAGDQADPDGDGVPNLLEYALGGNPRVEDPLILPALTQEDSRRQFIFRRNEALTDVTLTVQAADDPAGGWTDVARSSGGGAFELLADGYAIEETAAGPVKRVAVTEEVPVSRRFLRLQVSRPDGDSTDR